MRKCKLVVLGTSWDDVSSAIQYYTSLDVSNANNIVDNFQDFAYNCVSAINKPGQYEFHHTCKIGWTLWKYSAASTKAVRRRKAVTPS